MLREKLSERAGISVKRLDYLQYNASRMYKDFTIPKRNGEPRQIAQPTPELKAIQRWLVSALFSRLPTHGCATAYKKGASIRLNAQVHAASLFTLHIDFKDFFPSFSREHVMSYLNATTKLSPDDVLFCADLVCRHDRLTIGAPSSPAVTNALMYSFDMNIAKWCEVKGLVYSRYADDLNISSFSAGQLNDGLNVIKGFSSAFEYADLVINNSKTAFLSRKYKRSITGLNITPEGYLSIGRDRKREIKSLIHSAMVGTLPADQKWRVGGLIAFAYDVEPNFVISLRQKYGDKIIDELLHQKTPRGLNPKL
jgi:RNA-directed DNA polymerase